MQPRQTYVPRGFALRLELSLAMSDLRAFQPPRTSYHAYHFIAPSALFPLLHPILPAQKKRRGLKCSRGKHASRTALPCGFVLACHERTIWRANFIALSTLFPFLHPIYRHRKNAKSSNAAAPNMRPARFALRLEPCMVRTQDVGQRGRTTIDVVLLHSLHYFLLLHPIFRH